MARHARLYAGFGTGSTPPPILSTMARAAARLQARGYRLRTGAASRADEAFRSGAGTAAEIWLPWAGFMGQASTHLASPEAFDLGAELHPAWEQCSPYAKALHACCAHQILGADLQAPVDFILCWIGRDCEEDEPAVHAARVAAASGVPVFDMAAGVQKALNGVLSYVAAPPPEAIFGRGRQ